MEAELDLSKLLTEIDSVFTYHNPCGFLYERYQRIKAGTASENELESIYRLIESHVPSLRRKITLHYERLEQKAMNNNEIPFNKHHLDILKSSITTICDTLAVEDKVKDMLLKIQEMPKEWTIVQLTPQYNYTEDYNMDTEKYETNPLYLSVFNCGNKNAVPFSVLIDTPRNEKDASKIEILSEMMSIIQENKDHLTGLTSKGHFKNAREKLVYLEKAQRKETRLKCLVKDIQNRWLKEWRCLLMGKYLDEHVEITVREKIKGFFKSRSLEQYLTPKSEEILCCITKAVSYLSLTELKKAVQYCVSDYKDKTLVKELANFIRGLYEKTCSKSSDERRHPVILVLHETLDCIPFEMLDVTKNQPVTRIPSFYLAHFLFKAHQNDIKDGYKVITRYDSGSYVVNPDSNLPNMEIRMMNFFNYWLPEWTGVSGYKPSSEEFCDLLTSSDIFSYHGHGNGFHIIGVDKLERCHVKAVVLLFGCSSTKVTRLNPQVEMYGQYYVYLLARCPCVVGMLWEVTDTDTDTLTAEFLSRWIPSKAPVHWKYIDKEQWKKAKKNAPVESASCAVIDDISCEPDLSKALNLAKQELRYYTTKAACVVRGLPVKIATSSSKR